MNDMHKLQQEINQSVLGWLHSEMRSMRRRFNYVSKAVETPARRSLARPDAPESADKGGDIGRAGGGA